jgi:uncharacterized protein (TIGR02246 family)
MTVQRSDDEAEIRALLETYEGALNQSDPVLAAACYTSDGVFMPTTSPTIRGAALDDGYAALFGQIRLLVAFTIDELVVASELTAYAMTRSNGTQVVTATGEESAESNRELFIFSKREGSWKISRYLFNKPA